MSMEVLTKTQELTCVCVCVCCAGHEVSDSTMAELTLYTIGVGVEGGGWGLRSHQQDQQ